MHLPQAGGSKGVWIEVGEQFLRRLFELLAQQLDDQRAVQWCDLVVRAGQLGAHAFGQKTQFHAEQLRGFQRRALELVERTKKYAPQPGFMGRARIFLL